MTMTEIPTAIHRADDDLPWVDIGEGSLLKVLQIKEREGLWVVRNRFLPGVRGAAAQAHRPGVRVHPLVARGGTRSLPW